MLMSDLLVVSPAQMRRIEPFFSRSHGIPRVDDRRVVSGIAYVIRQGLQWKDAPKASSAITGVLGCCRPDFRQCAS
jgi:putative transposase